MAILEPLGYCLERKRSKKPDAFVVANNYERNRIISSFPPLHSRSSSPFLSLFRVWKSQNKAITFNMEWVDCGKDIISTICPAVKKVVDQTGKRGEGAISGTRVHWVIIHRRWHREIVARGRMLSHRDHLIVAPLRALPRDCLKPKSRPRFLWHFRQRLFSLRVCFHSSISWAFWKIVTGSISGNCFEIARVLLLLDDSFLLNELGKIYDRDNKN